MKKKLLALFLVASLVCASFAGCGNSESDVEDTSSTAVEENDAEEEEEETEIMPQRGVIADGAYTNEAFGISFPVADNLIVCTDEQIAQMLNMGQDMLAEDGTYDVEDMEEAMDGAIYDTVIMLSDNQSNVMVMYEDLEETGAIAYTEEQYAKAVANQLEAMQSMGYESQGITTESIGGTDFTVMTMGANGYSQKYYLHKVGGYMIEFITTFTEASEAEMNTFMSGVTFTDPTK